MTIARMGDDPLPKRQQIIRWGFLLLALAVPLLAGYVVYLQLHTPALDALLDGRSGRVLKVPQDSYADWAGLREGDIILSVDGVPFAQWQRPSIGNFPAEILRDGRRLTLELPLAPLARINGAALFVGVIVALIFWGGGTLLIWRRFRHEGVGVFFLLSQTFAVGALFMLAFPSAVRPWRLAVVSIISLHLAAPMLLHHAMLFPLPVGSSRQRRRVLIPIYLLALAVLLGVFFLGQTGMRLGVIYPTIEVSAALGVMIYVYVRNVQPDIRRRLRIILASNMAAGVPSILFYLLPGIFGLSFRLPGWIMGPFLAVAPLGYLYAIARHNLFGIDRLLNHTLVYVILSLGVFLLYLGPFALIYSLLPQDRLLQIMVAAGLTMVVGFSFDWVRSRVQGMVDRIFYGGWYDYATVIETISDALARTLDRERLTQVLTQQTPALMHLRSARFTILPADDAEIPVDDDAAAMQFRLRFQDQVRAVWTLGRRSDGDELTPTDRRILKTLARQAEIALSNALLIETLQQQLQDIRSSRALLTKTQQQLLRSREDERARLARELHDGPIQELVGLNLQLGMLIAQEGRKSPELKNALGDMRSEVKTLLQDMRRVCAELRPHLLDALGLTAALQALAEDWSAQHGVTTRLQIAADELDALPDEVAVNLYRIVQEALSNIARHARASQVIIRLTQGDAGLTLEIQDDGRGFTPPDSLHHLADGGHFGLVGIGERAKLIGGAWGVVSAPGAGTTVWVTLPDGT